MNITALEAHGVDGAVIRVWQAEGHNELLPVQEKAVCDCKVLKGQNIVVFSPTSSGKTFVGEMAAIRIARLNKQVVYLVPQKALAEEKYNEFKRKYEPLGIKVLISTRDRQEFDREIQNGDFNIAVAVFEKMQGLLVSYPQLLKRVGLVVIDELQMIGDNGRGGRLELLLTKIKLTATDAQIIGLSAVLGNSKKLAQWLNATLCTVEKRPVELRKGVIYGSEFRYVEHNSKRQAIEPVGQPPAEIHHDDQSLLTHVAHFAAQGEQCLVFCKTKPECVARARGLTKLLEQSGAANALKDIASLEDSGVNPMLSALLPYGVAFHNTDLSWEQRSVVERHFRSGDIRVLFTTSTLAMGMNLPARNVFLDAERWEQFDHSRGGMVPLTQSDYENISGRAGRYGLEPQFGRAIMVTDSRFDADTLFCVYAQGKVKEFTPALTNDALSAHILGLVATNLCDSRRQVREILLSSFTGEQHWRGGEREEEFNYRFDTGFEQCLDGELLVEDGKTLAATDLGRLAAMKGLAIKTAVHLATYANLRAEHASKLDPFEVLLCLANSDDGAGYPIGLSTDEYRSGKNVKHLQQLLMSFPLEVTGRLYAEWKSEYASYERVKALKKALVLREWIGGKTTEYIADMLKCPAGVVQGLADTIAWLAEAFSSVAKICGWPDEEVHKLENLARRIAYGVPNEGVELMALNVTGLGRKRTMSLLNAGIDSHKKVGRASIEKLDKLLTKPVAKAVREKIKAVLKCEDEPFDQEPDFVPDPEPTEAVAASDTTHIQLRLTGTTQNRRNVVMVNERHAHLQPKSFATLLRMAIAIKSDGNGWVDGTHKDIQRLRESLQIRGIKTTTLIENDSQKRYRLTAPPEKIEIDCGEIIRNVLLPHPVKMQLESYSTRVQAS